MVRERTLSPCGSGVRFLKMEFRSMIGDKR